MRRSHERIDSTKWSYSKGAFKKRYCERCGKRLRKDEALLCYACYQETMAGTDFNTG